ncbi:MAG TPA: hypothetical protein VK892_05365 [Pyrinomonadaceae bacterium]|nr:hypothetical protein [Pyrinomonadaceae bacterium]
MKFGKSILTPSYHREPNYNSGEPLDKTFEFLCVNCSVEISVKYNSLCGKEWSWKSDFSEIIVNEIKQFYKMNMVEKSPDGGSTFVIKVTCENCKTNYLIHAGVKESANSYYIVTLQGVTEIIEE